MPQVDGVNSLTAEVVKPFDMCCPAMDVGDTGRSNYWTVVCELRKNDDDARIKECFRGCNYKRSNKPQGYHTSIRRDMSNKKMIIEAHERYAIIMERGNKGESNISISKAMDISLTTIVRAKRWAE